MSTRTAGPGAPTLPSPRTLQVRAKALVHKFSFLKLSRDRRLSSATTTAPNDAVYSSRGTRSMDIIRKPFAAGAGAIPGLPHRHSLDLDHDHDHDHPDRAPSSLSTSTASPISLSSSHGPPLSPLSPPPRSSFVGSSRRTSRSIDQSTSLDIIPEANGDTAARVEQPQLQSQSLQRLSASLPRMSTSAQSAAPRGFLALPDSITGNFMFDEPDVISGMDNTVDIPHSFSHDTRQAYSRPSVLVGNPWEAKAPHPPIETTGQVDPFKHPSGHGKPQIHAQPSPTRASGANHQHEKGVNHQTTAVTERNGSPHNKRADNPSITIITTSPLPAPGSTDGSRNDISSASASASAATPTVPLRRSSLAQLIKATAPASPSGSRPRLSTLPPPIFEWGDSATARLSPTIVARQAPLPLRNLPTLPIPSQLSAGPSSASSGSARFLDPNAPKPSAAQRLRSMPALPMRPPRAVNENDEDDDELMTDGEEDDEDEDEDAEGAAGMESGDDEDESVVGASARPSLELDRDVASEKGKESKGRGIRLSGLSLPMSVSTPFKSSRPPTASSVATVKPGKAKAPSEASPNDRDYFTSPSNRTSREQTASTASSAAPSSHATPLRTPRPTDFFASPLATSVSSSSSPLAAPRHSTRPGIFHHESRSMVDLSLLVSRVKSPEDDSMPISKGKKKRTGTPQPPETPPTTAGPGLSAAGIRDDQPLSTLVDANAGATASKRLFRMPSRPKLKSPRPSVEKATKATPQPESLLQPPPSLRPGPSLRRQQSMPNFGPSSDPPAYPDFLHPRHPHASTFADIPPHTTQSAPHPLASASNIIPSRREEEGIESLPPYTNAICLTAIMPRKMEFTAPGEQARDRKWRRVLCVLEGTAFRVYKPPPAHGRGKVGEWWEKKVGVGDLTDVGSTLENALKARLTATNTEPVRKGEEPTSPTDGQEADTGQGSTTVILAPRTPRRSEDNQQRDTIAVPQPPAVTKSKLSNFLLPTRGINGSASSSNNNLRSGRSSFDVSRSPPSPRPSISLSRPPSRLSGATSPTSITHSVTTPSGSTSSASPSISSSAPRSGTSNSGASSSSAASSMGFRRGHGRSQSAATAPIPASGSASGARTPRGSTASTSAIGAAITSATAAAGATAQLPTPPATAINLPDPKSRELIRGYSLQHAESGLASDYVKRKNVVRVRMEGQQFLLQASDVTSVVEWIEGFQAAANISLDLDVRPMPRGPLIPRRRRRRRPQVAAAAASGGQASTTAGATSANRSTQS